jgi:glutamate-1-semialdehyde 2,1-aminomutase
VITGFRFSLGGAQKYFGVVPDLAAFGKSMANGMPISALVGKKKYMETVDKIFYSFTQGGEALSIAAAIATIKEIEKRKVIPYIWKLGKKLQDGTNNLLEKYGLSEFIKVQGKPCWQVFIIKDGLGYKSFEIKTYLQQEILQGGFLWYGQHNMSFSHTEKNIKNLLYTYDKIFAKLKNLLKSKNLKQNIKGGFISNIFKVR